MCDERTASRTSAMSTAKRNGLTGSHIIEMAQLQDHWTNGLDTPEYKHSAHLNLPKQDTPAVVELSTPTLADLLNPVIDDEELLFNHPDPYNIAGMGDEDDNEDDDSPPVIIRRVGGTRLDIELYVDLTNKKLQNRYDGKVEAVKVSSAGNSATKSAGPWVQENYAVDAVQF
ncbi:hypothetical protein C8J56DRAFT_960734 [Mycena floridula]|nr:hypothetical protein C8J56DRAFT_960734 [Mycena floridula]